MTRRCAWCETTTLREDEPVTHGICSMCEVEMEAEMEREAWGGRMSAPWTWDHRKTPAVYVERETRDKWADEAVAKVREGHTHFDISSGDAVVIALRMGDGSIRVYDCEVRREREEDR